MGFSAQSGLIQSSRTGDIDAYVIPYIMKKTGMTLDEVFTELSSNAGIKGLSGTSGDMRDVHEAIAKGSKRAKLALNKYIYDIKFYIGAFIYIMCGVDAVCFSGGAATNDPALRAEVLSNLSYLGFRLDEQANRENRERFDAEGSTIAAVMFNTNEELIVARETVKVAAGQG